MRDKVAPSCDESVAESLSAWTEWCEDPTTRADPNDDLVKCFHEFMLSLKIKPPVLHEIGCTETGKDSFISIFAIHWMATVSPWQLPVVKHTVWNAEVVRGWFAPDNAESADAFLERAETFLKKSFKGQSNGAKILYKVIQVP